MASSSWSRRDGRGEAAKSVQLRRLGGSRLRCRTRRLRWLGTSRAQFLPENPPIGTSSVHGTSSLWKRARVLSVLALASCSERIWVDAPAHRQRTMGRAERRGPWFRAVLSLRCESLSQKRPPPCCKFSAKMSFLLLKVRSNSDMHSAICKGALLYGFSEVQKGLKSAVQKNAQRHLVRSNS